MGIPENIEIMNAIQYGLNQINQDVPKPRSDSDAEWTSAVLTKLCRIGRKFGCKVGAEKSKVAKDQRDFGEWLYDVTWLRYDNDYHDKHLIEVPLVTECEWASKGTPREKFSAVKEDFHKLLLARASVRLMVYPYYACDGDINGKEPGDQTRRENAARNVAERLAESVREFRYRQEDDAWLLVGGVWNKDDWFRYFTIRNGQVVDFP